MADLAERTEETPGAIARKAIASYVERELATIHAIERGLAAVQAGQVIPHEDVQREALAIIEAARAKA